MLQTRFQPERREQERRSLRRTLWSSMRRFEFAIQLLYYLGELSSQMQLKVQMMLLGLAAVSLPNLFYRAEFNVPILVFAALFWHRRLSTAAYLFVLSWMVELYRMYFLIVSRDKDTADQRKPFLLSLTILAFVLKTALIIFLVIRHEEFRKQVSIPSWLNSIGKAIKGTD